MFEKQRSPHTSWIPHEKAKVRNPEGNTSIKREVKALKSGVGWRKDVFKGLCLKKLISLKKLGVKCKINLTVLNTKQLVGLNGTLNEQLNGVIRCKQ